MGREDSESSGDHLVRWLIPVGLTCILAAIVGRSVDAFGVQIPAVGSVPRQLVLGTVGIAMVVPGVWIEAKRRGKAVRRQLDAAQREQVRAQIELIARSLRQLLQAPTVLEFLIVEVDGVEGFYAQFVVEENSLHGELVSTRFLGPLHRPGRKQLQLLREYGWKPPEKQLPNFHKNFKESVQHARGVAREIMDLFINVYGVMPDDPLLVRFGDVPHYH